jgi:MATE family multidrug resistance protein
MASNISGWIYFVALVIYAIGWCKEGWNGLSLKAFLRNYGNLLN